MNGTVIFPFQQRPVFPGIRPGNGQIEIFSRSQVIENSRQYLPLRTDIYRKQSLGAPDIVRLFTSPSLSNVRNVVGEHIFFCRIVSILSDSNPISKRKREIRCRLFTRPIKCEILPKRKTGGRMHEQPQSYSVFVNSLLFLGSRRLRCTQLAFLLLSSHVV